MDDRLPFLDETLSPEGQALARHTLDTHPGALDLVGRALRWEGNCEFKAACDRLQVELSDLVTEMVTRYLAAGHR